jgi:phage-related protein
MKNFDPDTITQIEAESFHFFILLELNFSSTYYYTDGDIPVMYGGNKYIPRNFSFQDIAQSSSMSVDKVTIEIDNVDLTMSSLLLNEDVRNKTVKIYLGVKRHDVTPNTILVEQVFQGILGEWRIEGDSKVSLTVMNEFVLWNKKTLRNHSPSCQWAFKGTECGYAGGQTWCDQSHNRCDALGNKDNFGGFRWLPSITDKEIAWGRPAA